MDSQKPKHGHAHGHADTQLGFAEAYCPSCESSFSTEFDTCPNDGARLVQFAQDADELTGSVLDERFEIREQLGAGGMGTVYRALQTSVGRDVAIKVIHARLSRERSTAKRFLREAKLSSRLSQMNTVVVHDFGQSPDGMLYLVMELLKGSTLRAVLAGTEGLPLSRVKRIGIQLSDALHAAAELGIVHRDLKPSNIIILDRPVGRDRVKVLDFGLAKSLTADGPSTEITKSGALMGTPLYMAPEVIAGDEATPQSDLYALGCILYELVSGRPPFVGTSMSSLFAKHLTEAPAPLGLGDKDPELETLIISLLSKLPADRPSDATDVHARLGGETVVEQPARKPRGPHAPVIQDAASISGAPTLLAATVPDVATPPAPRKRVWIAVVALTLAICGGVVAWTRSGGTADNNPASRRAPAAAAPTPAAVGIDASVATPSASAPTPDAGGAARVLAPAETKSPPTPRVRPKTKRPKPRTRRKPKPPTAKPPTAKPPATKPPTTKPLPPPKLDWVD